MSSSVKGKMKKLIKKDIVEEAPTNSAGSGSVAGIGVGPDGEPGLSTSTRDKHKKRILKRAPPQALPMGWFAGKKTFKVPSHVFENAKLAKRKHQRWVSYLQEDEVGRAIREFANKNPYDPIILECEKTGYMCYARYGKK